MQPGKGIICIEDRIAVFATQIVFHILAGESRSAADHGELKLLPLQVLNDVLHFERGFHQQTAQPDRVRTMFLRGTDNRVPRLLDAKIDHLEPVVRKDDVHQILPNVVDVALHRRQNNRAFLRSGLLLHLGLEISDRGLHHSGGVQDRGKLHFARAKQVSDRLHAVQKDGIDELQR